MRVDWTFKTGQDSNSQREGSGLAASYLLCLSQYYAFQGTNLYQNIAPIMSFAGTETLNVFFCLQNNSQILHNWPQHTVIVLDGF